ncbi:venom carboxylesterase-6-like isoform X1 [Ceratina calcarata]|uniref:Carboxylic ester hydrolase n=1 Tax=Ceratina calcarata TaxID=156304 RepID=A0AAJ7IUR3_9HYME|nr:venom carboxylesterase-6-like isoform X1 [Ceratina calcarata]
MNAKTLSTVLFLLFTSLSCHGKKIVKVQTPLGRISGYRIINLYGKEYDVFMGIPYAQPPVGKLRFEPPQPIEKWEYELQATKGGYSCVQYDSTLRIPEKVSGCEDCLYLNVYVPVKNNSKTQLPVLIWIHGGRFQSGKGDLEDVDSFLNFDVILVTLNYRLGLFGFLSTGDSVVPGNMGLKDQNMAMRWVYKNIRSFGGNPKNITLIGFSSGGISIHYHYLSALSAGLFQRGISASGVVLSPTSLTKNAPAKAKELGASLGCPTSNSTQMISCLRQVSSRRLSEATDNFMVWLTAPIVPFGPVVEIPGPNAFISRPPIDIINSGKAYDVPWMTSVVSEEGLFAVSMFFNDDKLLEQLDENWTNISPFLLDFNDTIPLSQQRSVAQKIRRYFLGSNKIDNTDSSLRPLISMISDRIFVLGFEKAARLQAKRNKSPVWTLYYNYRANHSMSEYYSGGSTRNMGVCHGDDFLLWSSTVKSDDNKMRKILYDIYLSFAIHGKPRITGVKWQPLDPNKKKFQYLRISGLRNISMDTRSNVGHKNFWKTINFDENKISPTT